MRDRFGYMVPQQPRYAPYPEEQQAPAAQPQAGYGRPPHVAQAPVWPGQEEYPPPAPDYQQGPAYGPQAQWQPPRPQGEPPVHQQPYQPYDQVPYVYHQPQPFQEPPTAHEPVRRGKAEGRRKARRAPYIVLFVLCLAALGGMASFVHSASEPYEAFKQQRAFMKRQVFSEGIQVDGVAIGGLTMQQALDRVGQAGAMQDAGLNISVAVDGRSFGISGQQLPFERNVRAVLKSAWAIGRQGFPWMLGGDKTPFQVRYEHVQHTRDKLAIFHTQSSYNKETLRGLIAQIAAQVDREPKDAMIASFDFHTRQFTFTRDEAGARLDQQALFLLMSQQLDAGQLQQRHSVSSAPLLPNITAVELQNSFAQLASFSTDTTKDQKRNTNIELAARAVSGKMVPPGESFSFNKVVGERNAQKGYQMAPAIAGGVTFDEIGGGVCQVSSTLFNAAALADMQIVKRSPHAWPSSYVDKGRDATVNWPNLDFEFRNPKSTPVFVVASYAGRKLTVEIYGMRSQLGEAIRLETQLVSTTEPPSESILQLNASLAPGSQKVLKKARTGYLVDTYRVYTRGGEVYHREKLFSSNYRMVQQVIEYN